MGDISVPVLKGISLTVARGEMVALMGTSGSGKSTLMNILGCLDRPTSGEYWLDGEEVSRRTADERALLRNRKFGFVFQNFNLLPRTSALDNVAMPLSYTAGHLSERQARKQARKVLEQVGLADRLDHEPSQLSGGQQQRVAIARALVNNPPLIFADEPTGNLDSHTSAEVLRMFQKLNAQDGITIIIVTHDANVAKHAQKTIRIHDGLIVEATPNGPAEAAPGPKTAAAGVL
jgi:ABC-type lipoprotein export system ATPase subunit